MGECSVLDIADLVPNREELGCPKISNGLAPYAIGHRVFDRHLIGITPETRVRAFCEGLERVEEGETVSVIVCHNSQRLQLPYKETQRPDRERVAWWWAEAQVGYGGNMLTSDSSVQRWASYQTSLRDRCTHGVARLAHSDWW